MSILSKIRHFFGNAAVVTDETSNPLQNPSYQLGKEAALLSDRMMFMGASNSQSAYDDLHGRLEDMIKDGSFEFDRFNYGYGSLSEEIYTDSFDFLFLKEKFPEHYEGRDDGFVYEEPVPSV